MVSYMYTKWPLLQDELQIIHAQIEACFTTTPVSTIKLSHLSQVAAQWGTYSDDHIHQVFVPDSKASPKSFHERTTFCFRFYSHSFQSLLRSSVQNAEESPNISYGDKLKVELNRAISFSNKLSKYVCSQLHVQSIRLHIIESKQM